jgi:hypothetical protein
MQHHFIIYFDSEEKKWYTEDSWELLADGNVYNPNLIERGFPNDIYPGWFVPAEGSEDEKLDFELFQILQSAIDTLPIPQEA